VSCDSGRGFNIKPGFKNFVSILGCLRVYVNVICFVWIQCEGPWLLMYDYGVMWINAKVNACGDACANPAVLLLWTIQGEGPWLLARVSGSTFYILLYYTFSAFWLWSSVVSVLISVTTDMTPTGVLLVTSIFRWGEAVLSLLRRSYVLPWPGTLPGAAHPKTLGSMKSSCSSPSEPRTNRKSRNDNDRTTRE